MDTEDAILRELARVDALRLRCAELARRLDARRARLLAKLKALSAPARTFQAAPATETR